MTVSPHELSGPHPWDVIGMALPLHPLPTPIPGAAEPASVTPQFVVDPPEYQGPINGGIPPARRILLEMMLPNPQVGDRNVRRR